MPDTPLIAMEIHDASLWEPSRVLPVIEKMKKWGYNALVLHQNDLLDVCTQLDLTANYGVSDLRLKKVRNNTAWLNRLTQQLATFDAKLYLEIKEPSYHDYALELYPNLLGADGRPDPTLPIWFDFCRQKTDILLQHVPDIGGFIINLSSPESRVSLPDFLATHENSQHESSWFDDMINAFSKPLIDAGKSLYVRDFSYTSDMQSDVLSAVDRAGSDVGASIKITAHDYFPEYPINPVAKTIKSHFIFEFEAFGEHMGWGVIPNCRVGEFRERMMAYRDLGACGFLMRISWEAITGVHALDSLSAVNVYALPQLIDQDMDEKDLIINWLKADFQISGSVAQEAANLLLESWKIPTASYWFGGVFPRHSCLPSSWQEGWLSMRSNGMGRRDRDLNIDPNDPILSEQTRIKLFTEKEAASTLAITLHEKAKALSSHLPDDLAILFDAFSWLPLFANQFEWATKATFYTARAFDEDLDELEFIYEKLEECASQNRHKLNSTRNLAHHHAVLFDPNQTLRFAKSVLLKKVSASFK